MQVSSWHRKWILHGIPPQYKWFRPNADKWRGITNCHFCEPREKWLKIPTRRDNDDSSQKMGQPSNQLGHQCTAWKMVIPRASRAKWKMYNHAYQVGPQVFNATSNMLTAQHTQLLIQNRLPNPNPQKTIQWWPNCTNQPMAPTWQRSTGRNGHKCRWHKIPHC